MSKAIPKVPRAIAAAMGLWACLFAGLWVGLGPELAVAQSNAMRVRVDRVKLVQVIGLPDCEQNWDIYG